MDEDLAEVYNINSVPAVKNPADIDGPLPDWLRPIMANEKMKAVWQRLSKFTLVVNVCILTMFFVIMLYNVIVQLFMIPEVLGPVYVLAPVLLVFFCLFHALLGLGWLNALIFNVMVVLCSWIWEELGVLTGIIFGKYEYSELIPLHISRVPLEIPFSWFLYIYISFCLADMIVNRRLHARRREGLPKTRTVQVMESVIVAILTGIIAVGWDMISDPMGSVRCSIWIWEHGNGYFFGVPALNFFGWFWTTSGFTMLYLLVENFIPLKPLHKLSLGHELCPIVLYCSFILYYLLLSEPLELGFVALFTMGTPVILALIRVLSRVLTPAPSLDGYDPILEASKSYDDFYRK